MDDIILYTNDEIESLKSEVRRLELETSTVTSEIADAEKLIHEFGVRHATELGDIIKRLLKVRKDKLEHDLDGTETKKREFADAKFEYQQYNEQYDEALSENIFQLNEEEKKDLKAKYRKATKLCHPDLVADEFKEQAGIIFRELQKAYEINDLKKVQEILNMLENGLVFIYRSDATSTIGKLKAEILSFQNKLSELNNKLQELKTSEPYLTIITIGNWDEYFKEAKTKLLYEFSTIENN